MTNVSVSVDKDAVTKSLAREFVGLVFPRMISDFANQVQANIEAIKLLSKNSKGGSLGKDFANELKEHQKKFSKILSAEVQEKVVDKMVGLLAEELTAEELSYAIFQEKITIKITGVAARLETAFQEAIGEG